MFFSEASREKQRVTKSTPEYKEKWLSIVRSDKFRETGRKHFENARKDPEIAKKHHANLVKALNSPEAIARKRITSSIVGNKPEVQKKKRISLKKTIFIKNSKRILNDTVTVQD